MKKILVTVFMLFVLMACTSEPAAEKKSEYAINETAELKGMNITLTNVRILEGDEYFKPEEKEAWVALEFKFENTSDKSQYVAGIFDITLKDGDGREKTQNIWGDLEGSLDGDILAGDQMLGEKSFIIKKEDTELYAYYKPLASGVEPIKFLVKVGEE